MLEALLTVGGATVEQVRRLGRRIAEFHATAATSAEITRAGGADALARHIEENLASTERYVGELVTREALDDVAAYSHASLDVRGAILRSREAAGRVRDGHGDLHAAQICLENGIDFIDCIEFAPEYRYGDVGLDLAFLAMDLDHYDRPELSGALVDAYVEASGDAGVHELLGFFKCYRAHVRAKVTSIRLENAKLTAEAREAAAEEASAYYRQARAYAYAALPARSLFVVMGLPGTGKSTLARALANDRWGTPVSSDIERKRLAGLSPGEHRYVPFGTDLYSAEADRGTYESLIAEASRRLGSSGAVVLDASFRQPVYRAQAVAAARAVGADVWLIECVASPEVVRARIEARVAAGTDASDATWAVHERQRNAWAAVTEVASNRHLVVDTEAASEEVVRRVLHEIFARVLSTTNVGSSGG